MKKTTIIALGAISLLALTFMARTALAADPHGFKVARFVVCEGISDREPSGVTNEFDITAERAYVFLEARDIDEDTAVQFVWSYDGDELGRTEVRLGKGYRWRTNAWKNLYRQVGSWRVDLVDTGGNVIDTVSFTVH